MRRPASLSQILRHGLELYFIHGEFTEEQNDMKSSLNDPFLFPGAIFDAASSSGESRFAFSYELMNVDSYNTARIILDVNSRHIHINDSYSVATTSR